MKQFVWPNNQQLCEFIEEHKSLFTNKSILELGSGTGILYCTLWKLGYHQLYSSDYNDSDISNNIRYNCTLNKVPHNHIEHSWGEKWLSSIRPQIVIASDILLYTKMYSALVNTLKQLLIGSNQQQDKVEQSDFCNHPFFLLSAKRRVIDDHLFFEELTRNNFNIKDFGKRIYIITYNGNSTVSSEC